MQRPEVYCHRHPLTRMVCPRCIAAKGGRKTTAAYASSLSDWGKLGGRPFGKRKKKAKIKKGPARKRRTKKSPTA